MSFISCHCSLLFESAVNFGCDSRHERSDQGNVRYQDAGVGQDGFTLGEKPAVGEVGDLDVMSRSHEVSHAHDHDDQRERNNRALDSRWVLDHAEDRAEDSCEHRNFGS